MDTELNLPLVLRLILNQEEFGEIDGWSATVTSVIHALAKYRILG